MFSDEAHFWLNVYVSKQNYRFRSEGQAEELQKPPMNNEKVYELMASLDRTSSKMLRIVT